MRSITKGSIVFALTLMAAACGNDVSSTPLAPAGAALSQAGGRESLPFRGSISTADAGQVVGPNLEVVGTAVGTATHLGRFTATYHAVAPLGGNTATGSYEFTSANGDGFVATFSGMAAPDASGELMFTEVLTIVSGTGRFASATGTFTMTRTGVLDVPSGRSTGVGTMKGSVELNH
jgi:hypothetical protein